MDFGAIITFVTANWVDIVQGVLAVVGAASVIVKLTPTPKDDAILAVVINVLSKIALNPKPPAA